MHIAFQRSGGRGEYEVVGSHSGYTAISLDGWRLFLKWPVGFLRETGLRRNLRRCGKPRLRSTWSPAFQVGRMVAAMLMLPDPRREYEQTFDSMPIARAKGFVLARIGFRPETEFAGFTDQITVDASFVSLANLGGEESIGVRERWRRIQTVYASTEGLPSAVVDLIQAHREYLASGRPVNASLTEVVTALTKRLDPLQGNNPLPRFEERLGITPSSNPDLPPPTRSARRIPMSRSGPPISTASQAHAMRAPGSSGPQRGTRTASMRDLSGRLWRSAASAVRRRCRAHPGVEQV